MGSYATEVEDRRDEINVFVTGFGPFLDFHTNPSYLIASTLPRSIQPANGPCINIHAHPEPLTVAYNSVRSTIPQLIFSNGKPNYDVVLHIGLAHNRSFYALETLAHRDGYTKSDNDGDTMKDDTLWKDEYRSPGKLHPTFDPEEVWRQWKTRLPDEDLRPSHDPGRFLCDFVYYTSMVEYWRHARSRPVMFLHVPAGYAADDLERGRRVAVGLVEALVASLGKDGDREGEAAGERNEVHGLN